jgi:predicted peptidase
LRTAVTSTLAALVLMTTCARANDAPAKTTDAFEKRTFTGSNGKELRYRLLKPEGYDPSGTTAYPLVIFLHGIGERGDNNEAQLRHGVKEFANPETRKKHPCFVVAPQCPLSQVWARVERKGNDLVVSIPKDPTEPTALVLELMDALPKEFRIDASRVYITGLSMGGFGTWDILARQPDRFAAALPVCGGGVVDTAPAFAKIPLWVFHGAADPLVKPEHSRQMVEAVRKAGGKPGFTEYPGVGHDSWTMTYHNPDVLDWLFSKKKN